MTDAIAQSIQDIYSFNVEQARGDPHNLIIAIMHDLGVNMDDAFQWAADYCKELTTNFLRIYQKGLPSFGPEIDPQVKAYFEGLGNWTRGLDAWSFESARYFGKKGEEVRVSRKVEFLAKHRRVALEGVVSGLYIMHEDDEDESGADSATKM